ncbi:MAG: MBL fold metallo-hydrolase [Lachnospiraceae bacterium]|nr:MBL fold metallo-hydrolase [Lachnospiraceae bacterium]
MKNIWLYLRRNAGKAGTILVVLCLFLMSGCGSSGRGELLSVEDGQVIEETEGNTSQTDTEEALSLEVTDTGEHILSYGKISEEYFEIHQLPFPTFWGGAAYALHTPDEKLYIIDGGFLGEDGQRITQYINDHGGEVEGWILTHPHVDHIGAFLNFMEHNGSHVKAVYYAPFTPEFFQNEDPDVYALLNNAILFYEFENVKAATEAETEYIPMEQGDVLELSGMELRCFSSFRFDRKDINGNSLVFTVTVNGFSMLFTADMTEVTLQDMLTDYPNEETLVNPHVLQIPHHGYMAGISNDELYRLTKPQYALLDCTVEEYENNSVNIADHVTMIEALGIPVVRRFAGADGNRIRVYR